MKEKVLTLIGLSSVAALIIGDGVNNTSLVIAGFAGTYLTICCSFLLLLEKDMKCLIQTQYMIKNAKIYLMEKLQKGKLNKTEKTNGPHGNVTATF